MANLLVCVAIVAVTPVSSVIRRRKRRYENNAKAKRSRGIRVTGRKYGLSVFEAFVDANSRRSFYGPLLDLLQS